MNIGLSFNRTTQVTHLASRDSAGSGPETGLEYGDASRPGPLVKILLLVVVTQFMVIAVRLLTL